jgi:hypothetical protein
VPAGTVVVVAVPEASSRVVVALNVTITDSVADGYATVFDCSLAAPDTSTVNVQQGETAANLALVRVDEQVHACLTLSVAAHVVVDLVAVLADAAPLELASPHRLLDTRRLPVPTVAGGLVHVSVPIERGVAVVNVAVLGGELAGYVSAQPCYGPATDTSDVHATSGSVRAGLVFAPVMDGEICLRPSAPMGLIVDLVATTEADLAIHRREVDTRSAGTGPAVGPAAPLVVQAADDKAQAYTITATSAVGTGFVTAYSCRGSVPPTSTLNVAPGIAVANTVVVRGSLCLSSSVAVDLVVDRAAHLPDAEACAVGPGDTVTCSVGLALRAWSVRLLDTRSARFNVLAGTTDGP